MCGSSKLNLTYERLLLGSSQKPQGDNKSGHTHARLRASLDRPGRNHRFHEVMVADEGSPKGPS
jgi:hypothetical protein